MRKLCVLYRGRLMHAGAGFQGHFADPFVMKFHPALEHIHHLEFDFMMVAFRLRMQARLGPDDVRDDATVGRVADAQVAILEEGAQAIVPEFAGIGVAYREFVAVVHDSTPVAGDDATIMDRTVRDFSSGNAGAGRGAASRLRAACRSSTASRTPCAGRRRRMPGWCSTAPALRGIPPVRRRARS